VLLQRHFAAMALRVSAKAPAVEAGVA